MTFHRALSASVKPQCSDQVLNYAHNDSFTETVLAPVQHLSSASTFTETVPAPVEIQNGVFLR